MHRNAGDWHRICRAALATLVAALAGFFLVAHRHELPVTWQAVHDADRRWLAVGVLVAIAATVNKGMLQAAAQRAAGLDTSPLALVRITAAADALNDVTKTNGLAGMALFLRRAGQRHQGRGPTVAAYVLATLAANAAFVALLLISLELLSSHGGVTRSQQTATAVFLVVFTAKVLTLATAARSRSSVRALFRIPTRLLDIVRRRAPHPVDPAPADALFDATLLIRRRFRHLAVVEAHALMAQLIGMATLWVALSAVGEPVHPIVPVVGYAIALLFSQVSVVPGGLGFVEVSLGAVLVRFGAHGASAAAAVLVFRLFQLWLPLAIGTWCARSLRTDRLGNTPRDPLAASAQDGYVTNQVLSEGVLT